MSDDQQLPKVQPVSIVKMPPPHWASFAALVLSVVTAITLLWQGYETRTFYRLTMRPIVHSYVTDGYHEEMLGVFLKNHGSGHGTVIITGVFLDDTRKTPRMIIQEMNSSGLFNRNTEQRPIHRECGQEFSMAADRTVQLLAFPIDLVKTKDTNKQKLFQDYIHKRINFKYKWCSAYGKCYINCTNNSCREPKEIVQTTAAECVKQE